MTTSPLIIPVARFFSISGGAALAGGKVYTYAAGTDTPKATYTDFSGDTENTNPVILDSAGEADIWLDGNYKINLTDANDVQQANYPVDNVSSISSGSASEYAVTTGVANAYILTPAPAIVSYDEGTAFNIKINETNTGPSTINISNLGTEDLVVPPDYALAGGELIAGNIYRIVYDGTNFQILNPTPPIDIIMSAQATAPWGRLPMTGSTVAKTSGGTFNGAFYQRVYTYLWTNYSDSVAPVSTGRGLTAAADFNANKTITIPDYRDYSPFGVSVAGSITASGVKAGATTVTATGTVGTSGATTISEATMPAHTHTQGLWTNSAGATARIQAANLTVDTGNTQTSSSTGGGGSHTHTGGSLTMDAASVLHKVFGVYYYISY